MQKLMFSLASSLAFTEPVSDHHFALRIVPHDDPAQHITGMQVSVQPADETLKQQDGFGNVLVVGRALEPHCAFSYEVQGTAEIDSTHGRGSELNEIYRYPSALTKPGNGILVLRRLAGAWPGQSDASDPVALFAHARELCSVVHGCMEYVSGTTDVQTPAEEALAQGRGVCQDFAHILEVLLRMDGIPARYVSGLMIGEGATHAWVEFYDGSTWWGLDPTNDCEAGDLYVAIARGRDFSDCPLESGVFRGGGRQELTTSVSVQTID